MMSEKENNLQKEFVDEKKNYTEIQKEKVGELSKKASEYAKESVKTVASFKNLLSTVSNFTRYSENNIFLISSQNPNATILETFGNWQKKGGYIKKGAKAVHIIGVRNYVGKDEKKHYSFCDEARFDITDVEKAEVPAKRAYEPKELMKALVHSAAAIIKVDTEYPEDRTDGAYYDPKDNVIHCQYGMTVGDMFTSVCKAIAHSEISEANKNYRTEDGEFYARAVAYTLAKKYDISTNLCEIVSIPAEFQSMEGEQIHDEVCRIVNCVKNIDGRMREVLDRPKEKAKEENRENKSKSESESKDETDKDKEDCR